MADTTDKIRIGFIGCGGSVKCEVGGPPEMGLRVLERTEAAWRSNEQGGVLVNVETGG